MFNLFHSNASDKCLACQLPLQRNKRRDAKYCSAACRQAMQRLRTQRRNTSRRREAAAA